ncbi:TetR/AcrR family transcriptional regulator [Carnobacterium gallinarum]|uniref:TetR/AcrR family transcriptional regulator n=1 Tax=Carnobacterium gallinarum TaxID=2749 RepID=UPI000552E5F6|nr:TetR/AcrR family transcriptional regulator [Carnobacterium gallinarum]
MPTQTFFNLPEDKQQRLLDAASAEFSRVPFNSASINNIIKLAEISRGSFYQYFEDKEDLYYYFFNSLKKDSRKLLEECLTEANGDLFLGYKYYFPKMFKMITEEKHAEFFRNMFLHMDYRTSRKVSPGVKKRECTKKHGDLKGHLYEFVNMDSLNIEPSEDFHLLIRLLMTILFQTIGDTFAREMSEEEAVTSFNKKLSWLQDGVYLKK